ncbi:MAG: YgjV family protein [Clostridia bacterium]|nr:YgjV family protein [Clostridia bacterium]
MSEQALAILIQVIGYIGVLFVVIAFQCKTHKRVIVLKTTNELIFALQYFLLGAYTGVAMNLVGSLRNFIFVAQVEKGKSTRVAQVVFSLFFVVFGILTWQGPISIAVIAAKLVTTIAYGLKNTRLIRFLTLPTSICWLIYNVVANSSAGVLCEAFTSLSILTAILRIELIEPWVQKRKAAKAAAGESRAEKTE